MSESDLFEMLSTSGNAIQFFIAYMLWKISNDMRTMSIEIQTMRTDIMYLKNKMMAVK